MYLDFYGLNHKPFSISPDPKFLWLSPKHQQAISVLQYGLLEDKGFLVLMGEVGTGKTLLIKNLIRNSPIPAIIVDIPDKVYEMCVGSLTLALWVGLVVSTSGADPSGNGSNGEPEVLDTAAVAEGAEVIEELSEGGLWGSVPAGLESFERIAFREMKLACEMDILACRRALMVRSMRAGREVCGAERKELARRLDSMTDQFEAFWMARNRKSRVGDNMRLLRRASNLGQ